MSCAGWWSTSRASLIRSSAKPCGKTSRPLSLSRWKKRGRWPRPRQVQRVRPEQRAGRRRTSMPTRTTSPTAPSRVSWTRCWAATSKCGRWWISSPGAVRTIRSWLARRASARPPWLRGSRCESCRAMCRPCCATSRCARSTSRCCRPAPASRANLKTVSKDSSRKSNHRPPRSSCSSTRRIP